MPGNKSLNGERTEERGRKTRGSSRKIAFSTQKHRKGEILQKNFQKNRGYECRTEANKLLNLWQSNAYLRCIIGSVDNREKLFIQNDDQPTENMDQSLDTNLAVSPSHKTVLHEKKIFHEVSDYSRLQKTRTPTGFRIQRLPEIAKILQKKQNFEPKVQKKTQINRRKPVEKN